MHAVKTDLEVVAQSSLDNTATGAWVEVGRNSVAEGQGPIETRATSHSATDLLG